MSNYQIYVNGEATNNFYKAETKEDALDEYKEDYIEEYKRNFGCEPDMDCFDWVEALEIYPMG